MKTKTNQIQQYEDYHISCQHCGSNSNPIHILPLRNETNVVGMIFSCDDCHDELAGKTFDKINQSNKEK